MSNSKHLITDDFIDLDTAELNTANGGQDASAQVAQPVIDPAKLGGTAPTTAPTDVVPKPFTGRPPGRR